MVRRGQMEAHNFDELLRQVAEEVREPVKKNLFKKETPDLFGYHETTRWCLKETEVNQADEAETRPDDAAARSVVAFIDRCRFTSNIKKAIKYLQKAAEIRSRHFSSWASRCNWTENIRNQ